MASMNYDYKSYIQNNNIPYNYRSNIPLDDDMWIPEIQNQHTERLSASRNQTYYGGISEQEEEKNRNLRNSRYTKQIPDNDYYNEGSINYYKNSYNQKKIKNDFDSNIKNFTEMQQQQATTLQQKKKDDNKQKETSENQQKEKNNNQQDNSKTEEKQKNQQEDKNQTYRRNNNRERRNYSPSYRQNNNGQYRTRSFSSNSNTSRYTNNSNYNRNRSNSRPKRNNNNYYNNNNRYQIQQFNQNRNNNKYRSIQRNYDNQVVQQKQQQKSITYTEQQRINHALSETCRYWLNTTCRNPECERQHYKMIQLMNLYYKPRGKRIKNNITDHNNLDEDISKQKFCVQINITREMTIQDIREYISKKSKKIEEQEINNIIINMAVKDERKIQQEIKNIINTTLIELEKENETINQTQASLITTEEILKQINVEEFINIRQAFTEKNKEQEYENVRSREFHIKQIEKIKQLKERKSKEMEVEENFIRVSQNQPIYKPQIQQNQFFNFKQVNNIELIQSQSKPIIENISEEDKVNKPQTSSEERQITQSPMLKKQSVTWQKMKVDTSVALLKDQEQIVLDSFKIVNQAISDQKICFSKVNTKQLFKEYLTKNNVDTRQNVKDIPTGIYLIMIIEAQYINQAKQIAKQNKHRAEYEANIQAFTEAIATYALGILPYQIESDKIKLSASRQHITMKLIEIIQQDEEIMQSQLFQIRTQTQQNTNLNITIHVSPNFIQDKNLLIDMTK